MALGVFLADAIDTLEKYVPAYSDQDWDLAEYIGANFKDLGVSPDEVYKLTYLAAIPEGKEEDVPDSSLRYFLTIDPRTGQSTIECHLNFIEGKPFFPMTISFKRILVTTFYEYLRERLFEVLKPEELLPIGVSGEGLDIPIKDLITKKALIVNELSLLSEVLKQLREKEADVIIVQDKHKNILGVVDSNDFLRVLERKH
ncbi:MAG: CBS domain-containing protein [Candidatus Omnitrophica bacterium]|nr:CBS domain-containing protein [Candidatus Omnitrophota bacterium]